jgi:hypothetical protein
MLWGCDESPIVVALRNTAGGKFDLKVWRGRCGNGVVLKVEPCSNSRMVNTVWRKVRGTDGSFKEADAWGWFGIDKEWDRRVLDLRPG